MRKKPLIVALAVLGLATGGWLYIRSLHGRIDELSKIVAARPPEGATTPAPAPADPPAPKPAPGPSELIAAMAGLGTAFNRDVALTAAACAEIELEIVQRPSADAMSRYKREVERLGMASADGLVHAEEIVRLLAELPATALAEEVREKVAADALRIREHLRAVGAAARASASSVRDSQYDIYANQLWQSCDLSVASGEIIVVRGSGSWRWGRHLGNAVGPAGEAGGTDYRLVTGLGNGALLARVRGSETAWPGVGTMSPARDGRLEFRINDNQVTDNTGTLAVQMWAFRPLSWPRPQHFDVAQAFSLHQTASARPGTK